MTSAAAWCRCADFWNSRAGCRESVITDATDMLPIIEGCLASRKSTGWSRKRRRLKGNPTKNCDLEILRANLRALRHCKAEAYAPIPANNRVALRGMASCHP